MRVFTFKNIVTKKKIYKHIATFSFYLEFDSVGATGFQDQELHTGAAIPYPHLFFEGVSVRLAGASYIALSSSLFNFYIQNFLTTHIFSIKRVSNCRAGAAIPHSNYKLPCLCCFKSGFQIVLQGSSFNPSFRLNVYLFMSIKNFH